MKKWITLAALAAGIVSCTDANRPATEAILAAPRTAVQSDIVGAYIVTLRGDIDDVDNVANGLAGQHRGQLRHIYKAALNGFLIENLPDAAAAAIARDPRVIRVEADQVMTAITTQSGATWGIDRIDQDSRPLSGTYTYDADGTGVSVYIIDTGINITHNDFGGRAQKGIDEITPGGSAADCNGHGTHVSGTVGGTTWGVAKNVHLYAVRVLNCSGSGTTGGVIAGIDWVTQNHASPAVANMSLGGGFSVSLNQAVANAVASGVTFAVAAGNSAADACNSSPSSEPLAITVGSTTSTDAMSSFSNYGSCVDIFAPGSSITSAWYTTNSATNTISGTSMASPHVAGAAALYLSANPSANPAAVASALTGNASANKITTSLPSGTPNKLLYTGFIGGGVTPPPPSGSIARFTYSCSGTTCTFNGTSSTGVDPVAPSSWAWTFGDNGSGTDSVISHAFGGRQNYTVTLSTTPAGSQSTTSKTIRCKPTRCS